MASNDRTGTSSSVRQLQDAGKAVVGAAGSVAADRMKAEVDVRSSRAAVEMKAFAVAMRASSSSLRDQGHDSEADVVDQLAGRADRLAARLSTATTEQLVDDVKRLSREAMVFARREPALAIASAFTVGLLIPKLLDLIATKKRANPSRRSERDDLRLPTGAEVTELEIVEVDVTPEPEEEL